MQSEMQPNVYYPILIPCPTCALPARSIRGRVAASGAPTFWADCGAGHQWQIECEPKALDGADRLVGQVPLTPLSAGTQRAAREVDALARGLRIYTEELAGPLEVLVMSLALALHDEEHKHCDWFSHNGSTVTSFCRRACEQRGLDWAWVYAAIQRERLDERTETR